MAVLFANQIQAQSIDLKTSTSTSQIHSIKTRLEGQGVVIPEDDKALKMSVDATFQYDERVIARTSQLKSIRSYQKAFARLRVDHKPLLNQLSSGNHIVISQTRAADQPIKIASLGGPITQNEFELLNTPANTLILAEVFAKNSVEKGDKWKPESQVLARFLNVDSVDNSDVEIELSTIKGKIAALVISGETSGTIDGATTELSLNGSVLFDTAQGIITQSQMTISQQRDIGVIAPGLDATFKMMTTIQPTATSKHLTDEGLAALRKRAGKITDHLLLTPNSGSVSILHPRRWRVIANHQARTILRYNKNGRMLGQCDIIPLPNRLDNQEQTLEQFKAVVKNKLSQNEAKITGATRAQTPNGLEWLRVDAIGNTEGVDLQWTYYTINSPDGRRIQMVFTTEPSNARAFAGMDQYLIDSVQFESRNKTPGQNAGYRKTGS